MAKPDTESDAESDPYFPVLQQHWDTLTGMYTLFEDRGALVEFDVASRQIRVYPAMDYIETLTPRTRERQYRRVLAEGALMVFVRDESRQILRSYIFPLAEESSKGARRRKAGPALQSAPGQAAVERSNPGTKDDIAEVYAALHAIYSRHRRRHRENPDSRQMCCMWSTKHPPDVIEGTAPLCDIEDAFGIEVGDEEAARLYDMDLDQAAQRIVQIRKKQVRKQARKKRS
jgi:hypothetical protein